MTTKMCQSQPQQWEIKTQNAKKMFNQERANRQSAFWGEGEYNNCVESLRLVSLLFIRHIESDG